MLRAYCAELEKDLADLEGWKYRCTEGNPNRKEFGKTALELWLKKENSGRLVKKDWYIS